VVEVGTPYDDPIAHLTGAWKANHQAWSVIRNSNPQVTGYEEVRR